LREKVPHDHLPNTNYELIAIDVDGTLLNSKFELSDGIEEALIAIREKGIHPVLITDRSFWAIEHFLQKLAVSPYYISDGGARVGHFKHGIITLSPIRRKNAVFITRLTRQHGLGIGFHEMNSMSCEIDEKILDEIQRITSHEIANVKDILASTHGDPVKITIFGDQDQLRSLDQDLRKSKCRIHTAFSGPTYLEITNQGVSKGNGLKLLADHLGISPHKIMAFGDQENDLSTFQMAGYSVAMGNAPEVVKQAAHFVTRSNDEGGLAYALQQILLNDKEPPIDD
jgi:Cof subfamily protein (haloacid dehalogenase superfamily)